MLGLQACNITPGFQSVLTYQEVTILILFSKKILVSPQKFGVMDISRQGSQWQSPRPSENLHAASTDWQSLDWISHSRVCPRVASANSLTASTDTKTKMKQSQGRQSMVQVFDANTKKAV